MRTKSSSGRLLVMAIAALGIVAIGAPSSISALAADDGSPLFVQAQNVENPEFSSTVGRDGSERPPRPETPGTDLPIPEETEIPEAPEPTELPAEGAEEIPEPTPEETEAPSAPPEVVAPVEEIKPVFAAGPGSYEISKISWNQMSAKQVCVDVTVRGTGGTVENWYLTMDAATVPLNHDFNPSSYQFPTWGYGFEGSFQGSKIKIVGNRYSQWNDFSTLTGGQERTLKICNWNAPKPPATHRVELTVLSETPGTWNWNARYRVSAPEAEFYTSWKVRVDLSRVNADYRGSAPIHSEPGPGDLKITHISGDIYEVEGIGWPNMGVRSNHSIEFRIGR